MTESLDLESSVEKVAKAGLDAHSSRSLLTCAAYGAMTPISPGERTLSMPSTRVSRGDADRRVSTTATAARASASLRTERPSGALRSAPSISTKAMGIRPYWPVVLPGHGRPSAGGLSTGVGLELTLPP